MTRLSRQDVSSGATPAQPTVWTLVNFEADDAVANELAEALAASLLAEGGWYADFRVGDDHVIVFAEKVFRYRCGDPAGRAEAAAYGASVGVPPPPARLGRLTAPAVVRTVPPSPWPAPSLVSLDLVHDTARNAG